MIIGVLEDGTVLVLSDLAAAQREIESYDAESGAAAFYDSQGVPLSPQFPVRPTRRFLGLRVDADPGPFELAPAEAGTTRSIMDALNGAKHMVQNSFFASLADLRAHFAARAV